MFHRASHFFPKRISTGWIAVLFLQVWQHRVQHLRIDRRGCVVIEINHRKNPPKTANGSETKENKFNRRLTQMYADRFFEISLRDSYSPYLRLSVFIPRF